LESRTLEESAASRPARKRRPPRRPERQQIVLRRALALGAGLLLLVLIVIGVKGCLDARKSRALSDYSRNVTQIVNETDATSKGFFEKFAEPGELSVTEFVAEVNADRSATEGYLSRVEGLSAPGDMGHAQDTLELVYELRSSAMTAIAEKMSTALGTRGREKATAAIAGQMEKLLAGDVLYSTVVQPEIGRVLSENGIEGDEVPDSVFLPEGTKWLDEATVSAALSSVNGASESEVSGGVHGLGLSGTSVNGTELTPEASSTVALEGETPEVEVAVQNQGESTENAITVTVTVDGAELSDTISSIGVEETETAVIPLTSAPKGEATLEVSVQSVPGEEVTTNNEATYTVQFE
jgi:hypothetical protein